MKDVGIRSFQVVYFYYFYSISLVADGPNVALLPVVTNDLPVFPRFTPYEFLSRFKFITGTTRPPIVNFTYSRSNAFRYVRQNINPNLTRNEITTSTLEGVQVAY